MAVYVVLAPESIQGIYATWPECQARVTGVPGATFQKAPSREAAEAMLAGKTEELPAGTYAFIDGNHLGGIGVVLVHKTADGKESRREIATTLAQVFPQGIYLLNDGPIPAAQALASIRNIATELAACYAALGAVKPGTALTVVHDYEGVGAWLIGRWTIKDPIVRTLVHLIEERIAQGRLEVRFRHQRGHQADRRNLNAWIQENRRADALATQAAARQPVWMTPATSSSM